MNRRTQIGLVIALGVAATVLVGLRLPGLWDEAMRSYRQAFQQEFSRSQTASSNRPQASPTAAPTAAPTLADLTVMKMVPDTTSVLREQVRSRRLSSQSEHTVGQQLDWSFRDHTWQSGTLPSGLQIARFEASLSPDAALAVRQSLTEQLDHVPLQQSRSQVEDGISEIQGGTMLQLDFSIRPGSQFVVIERIAPERSTLVGAGLPLQAWVAGFLQ